MIMRRSLAFLALFSTMADVASASVVGFYYIYNSLGQQLQTLSLTTPKLGTPSNVDLSEVWSVSQASKTGNGKVLIGSNRQERFFSFAKVCLSSYLIPNRRTLLTFALPGN